MNELDALTRLAILGTTRAPELGPLGGVEGQVLRALEGVSLERRLLLAAGARSVARAAGRALTTLDAREGLAPAETLEAVSPRVSGVLGELLAAEDIEVLREAFILMARARRRLPPELLPPVLALKEGPARAAANAVLGERGHWLSRLNPAWNASAPDADAPEAERRWNEGSPETRRAVLEQTRAREPARAREWLQGTWAQEKAEHRARFLACLDTGLSAADEPLLELGRKDRASAVREVARYLLARLPGSAFAQRMAERARAAVHWEAPSTLRLTLPAQWDAEAERDGLDKPPPGMAAGEHWLIHLLECVPLASWEVWDAATPAQLVAAAERTEYGIALSEGWAQAFHLGPSAPWAAALLAFWARQESKSLEPERAQSLAVTVLEQLPPAERAARALRVLGGAESLPSLERALAVTSAPWPAPLGHAWLDALRAQTEMSSRAMALLGSLRHASLALPPECLARASEDFLPPPGLSHWLQPLHRFQRTTQLRRILHEELTP